MLPGREHSRRLRGRNGLVQGLVQVRSGAGTRVSGIWDLSRVQAGPSWAVRQPSGWDAGSPHSMPKVHLSLGLKPEANDIDQQGRGTE